MIYIFHLGISWFKYAFSKELAIKATLTPPSSPGVLASPRAWGRELRLIWLLLPRTRGSLLRAKSITTPPQAILMNSLEERKVMLIVEV